MKKGRRVRPFVNGVSSSELKDELPFVRYKGHGGISSWFNADLRSLEAGYVNFCWNGKTSVLFVSGMKWTVFLIRFCSLLSMVFTV